MPRLAAQPRRPAPTRPKETMVGEPCNHLGMVYTTHLWWFWGWFIIGSTTLQYLWWYTSIQIFDCDMHSHGYSVEMYKHMLYMYTQLVCICTYTCPVGWLELIWFRSFHRGPSESIQSYERVLQHANGGDERRRQLVAPLGVQMGGELGMLT